MKIEKYKYPIVFGLVGILAGPMGVILGVFIGLFFTQKDET